VAEDVEAVVRELERLQREQARIQAILQKYQKMEEERKALLKKVEGEINEAKEKMTSAGIEPTVLDDLRIIIDSPKTLTIPLMTRDEFEAVAEVCKQQAESGVARDFWANAEKYFKRWVSICRVFEAFQRNIDAGNLPTMPPVKPEYKAFNFLAEKVRRGEEIKPDTIVFSVEKTIQPRTATATRGRRTRRIGIKAFVRRLLEERGEITIEEAVDELISAGLAETEDEAKRRFNSAQYSIVHDDGDAEYIDGVLRLLPE